MLWSILNCHLDRQISTSHSAIIVTVRATPIAAAATGCQKPVYRCRENSDPALQGLQDPIIAQACAGVRWQDVTAQLHAYAGIRRL